jgi:hypothetical protein
MTRNELPFHKYGTNKTVCLEFGPSPSNESNRSRGLQEFATVSIQLSVHTGKSPRVSAARGRIRAHADYVYLYGLTVVLGAI